MKVAILQTCYAQVTLKRFGPEKGGVTAFSQVAHLLQNGEEMAAASADVRSFSRPCLYHVPFVLCLLSLASGTTEFF